MHTPQFAFAVLAAFLMLQEPVDYSKVDRKIVSQPKYLAAPRYALLLLGPEGTTKIWMAMDKSKAGQEHYDVLYVDRDGDGNLGEEGERVTAPLNSHGGLDFRLGKVEIPGAKVLLEDFQLTSYPHGSTRATFVSFKLSEKVKMYGAYGRNGTYLQFGESPEKAPVLHADPTATLAFLHMGPEEMKIGVEDTVMLYIGNPGSGPATLLAVDDKFLNLEKDKLLVTLIAKDREGKEMRRRTQLKESC